jgi:hypothetical protein
MGLVRVGCLRSCWFQYSSAVSGREFLVMLAPSFYRTIMRHILTVDSGGVAQASTIELRRRI